MKNIKKKLIYTGVILLLFLIPYILSYTVLKNVRNFLWTSEWTVFSSGAQPFGWTARHFYFFLFVPALVVVWFDKKIAAIAIPIGNIVGNLAGYLIEGMIYSYNYQFYTADMDAREYYFKYQYSYGVQIWADFMIASIVIGIISEIVISIVKRHKKRNYSHT